MCEWRGVACGNLVDFWIRVVISGEGGRFRGCGWRSFWVFLVVERGVENVSF